MKTIFIIITGSALYIFLTTFLGFYQLDKRDLNWGLSIYYNYYIFGFTYILAGILALSLETKWSLWINGLLFLGYSYFWSFSFSEYPNRVTSILLSSFIIYALGTFLIVKSKES